MLRSIPCPVVVLLCLAQAVLLAADTRHGRHLDALRAKGAYAEAEKYCEEKLSAPGTPVAEQAELTIEYSRTLAEHARELPPEPSAGLWRRATRVADDFVAEHPDDPRLLLVEMQAALGLVAQGQAERLENEGGSEAALEAPRATLREAIARLRKIEKAIGEQLRRAGRPVPGALSAPELQSLEMHVRFELARAFDEQAQCYRLGSADRINALTQSGEALTEVLRWKSETPLLWSAALEETARLRLLGEFPSAEKQLEELAKRAPPEPFAGQVRAERIRLALARGRVDEALGEAGTQQPPSPEADFARLEALVAAWHHEARRQDDKRATAWQEHAIEQAHQIAQAYGPFWMRRSEAFVARAVAAAGGPQSPETVAFAAAGYYRAGQLDRARAAFEQAARQAESRGQSQRALGWTLSAAAIDKERGDFQAALGRYRTAALSAPDDPRAPEAHLLAVFCAGQLAQAQDPPDLSAYEELLREHVERWPAGATASQAFGRLGRLQEHRGDWQAAIASLSQVRPDDPQYAEAVAATGRSYEAWLDELRERGENVAKLAERGLDTLERVIGDSAGPMARPNEASRAAVLATARLWLKEVPNGAMPAERLLRGALDNDSAAPPDWQTAAQELLVPALAAQGKGAQADALLGQILQAESADLPKLLETVAEVRRRSGEDAARRLADLELAAQRKILAREGTVSGDTLRAVRRQHALTLAETGKRSQALEEVQALVRAFPRDGEAHEALAKLLTQGDADERREAVQKWAEVITRSRPGTPRWFRAHVQLARTQLSLGQRADARRTVEHVASRYPEFGSPEWKRQFDELEAAIERAR